MSAHHAPGQSFRSDYQQAFREARAGGRIGYRILRNPRARMAAAEALCLRLHDDELTAFRRRFAYCGGWDRMADRAAGVRP